MKKRSQKERFFYDIIQIMQPKKNFLQKIISYVEEKESTLRNYLRKHPFLYTFIGSIAVILFWRGIWHTADLIPFLNGPVSIIVGGLILVVTGLFIASFFGEIISGLKKEEKIVVKTEGEVKKEGVELEMMQTTLKKIEVEIDHLHREHLNKHDNDKNPDKSS